jgi:hypothetical protein
MNQFAGQYKINNKTEVMKGVLRPTLVLDHCVKNVIAV